MLVTAALALVSLAVQEPARPAAVAETHDLSCTVTLNVPVLVSSRYKIKGKLEAVSGGAKVPISFDRAESIEHVDRYTSIDKPKPGAFVAQRKYVKFQRDEEKLCKDPEWNGVSLTLTDDGIETRVNLDGRLAREAEVQRLLDRAQYAGAWLPLPKAALVGSAVELDPLAIAHLLHVDDARPEGSAKLRFAAIDAAGLATITGELVIPTATREDPLIVTHTGACTIVVDTARHKVVELRWGGDAVFRGADDTVAVSGRMPFECTLTATHGEAAEKALDQKAVIRDHVREFKPAKLEFALPSHYYVAEGVKEPDLVLYKSTVAGPDAPLLVELKSFEIAKADHAAVLESAMKAMRDNAALKVLEERAEPSPLGKGKLMRYLVDGEEQWMAVLPCGDHGLVRIKVLTAAANKRDLPGIWSKLKSSLKRAK